MNRTLLLSLLTVIALLFFGLEIRAFEGAVDLKPQQWAILIGVERYEKASPLQYTVNDVKRLTDTLMNRAGLSRGHVLEITDDRTEMAFRPRKEGLMAKLQEWLAKPGEHDSVIVYFSGHGFRDEAGKLYLAPVECDPIDPTQSGIAVEWFREQLANCKAGSKLLILDACHAGSEKGEQPRSVSSSDIGAQFDQLDRVVTIASCKASEKSQIWAAKEQSLFSYWLNEGLRGHADQDANGAVDIDELYKFVERRVRRTAENRFRRPQTPVRIVRSGVSGVPNVVTLQPQKLKTVLADIAEQLAVSLEEQQLKKVGVLEFTDDTTVNEALGGGFGLLGKYCSQELESALLVESDSGKFRVLDRKRLQQALKEQQFRLQDLSSTTKLVSLSSSVGGLPVFAVSSFKKRSGRIVNIQCKLQSTETEDIVGEAAGSFALSEDEWAMLGRSTAVRPEDRRPSISDAPVGVLPPESTVISNLDTRAQAGHPLLDPTFPFNVQLKIKGEVRKGAVRGNDYLIPVRKNEEYEIVVENKSGGLAVMKLLVDGLDTLPKAAASAGAMQGEKGIVTELWAEPVVNLTDARAWILDPKGPELRGAAPRWFIKGFATKTGTDGNMKAFVIVDAAESLAGRQGFTEQVGLITAAFYAPGSGSRGSLGTAAGSDVKQDLTERNAPKAGKLIGVVHLRYVDAEALENAGK